MKIPLKREFRITIWIIARAPLVEQERKVGDAAVAKRIRLLLIVLICITSQGLVHADELPENEIQATFNGYFDNFRVNILYPMLSITKRISGSSSMTGRYLVDCITAASMRSRYDMDGVTSATSRNRIDGVSSASRRPEKPAFDEVRHEFNAGIVHLIGQGTLSINALFSTEHDYRSWTAAAQISYPFAMKNTTVQLGMVRSWDQVFPDTRDWTRKKYVITGSMGLTQVLNATWIAQINASVTHMTGYLSDPYQPVPIFKNNDFIYHETVLPSSRIRKALGFRSNWMWFQNASVQAGYRYYWDDWGIRSHTTHVLFQQYLADKMISLGVGLRRYQQTQADFFESEYFSDDHFLTVDSKLSTCWSNEYTINLDIKGAYFHNKFFEKLLYHEKMTYHVSIGFYQRRTPIADWFSRYKNLYAYTVSAGVRYRFD